MKYDKSPQTLMHIVKIQPDVVDAYGIHEIERSLLSEIDIPENREALEYLYNNFFP